MPTPQCLVVDGSNTARYRLRIALRRHGADVVTASSAEQAIDLLQRADAGGRPHVVFANRVLPGMNGLELLELLQLDAGTAALPVVITGADTHWPLHDVALQRGAAALLAPDADAEAVSGLLQRLVAGQLRPTPFIANDRWSGRIDPPAPDANPTPVPVPTSPSRISPSQPSYHQRPAYPPPPGPNSPLQSSHRLPLGLLVAGTAATLLALLLGHP